ncbi:MAG: hypothetical protein WAT20_06560 [Ferruginibacter sp.]|nr:hypothetical protein [Chitinophagaceae bacterium]
MVVIVRVDMSLSYTQIYEFEPHQPTGRQVEYRKTIDEHIDYVKSMFLSFYVVQHGNLIPLKNKTVPLPSTSFHKKACCRPCGHNNFPADSEFATSLPAHTNTNKPFNAI